MAPAIPTEGTRHCSTYHFGLLHDDADGCKCFLGGPPQPDVIDETAKPWNRKASHDLGMVLLMKSRTREGEDNKDHD